MDQLAYEMLKSKLMSLTGINYQYAIDTIYSIVYGSDFTSIKQKRDKGSDGFVFGNTSLAIYAPEKHTLSEFKKKTQSDFKKYDTNWKSLYPSWQVITNRETTGEMILQVNKLYRNSELISVINICDLIRNQNWSKILRIFKSLGLAEQYLTYNIFSMIIDDLTSSVDTNIEYSSPTYIGDKVDLNIDDIYSREIFIEEYESLFSSFQILQNVLSEYDKTKVSA